MYRGSRMRLACLGLLALCAAGCGLMLDMEPRRSGLRPGSDAGAADAASGDTGGVPVDASMPDTDAGPMTTDAGGADAGPTATVCFSDGDCAPGTGCAFVFAPRGVCTTPCAGDDECTAGPGANCRITGSFCSPSCDPVSNAGCSGLACGFFSSSTAEGADDSTYCADYEMGTPGSSCYTGSGFDPWACDIQSWCVPNAAGTDATCMHKCRMGPGSVCPAASPCTRIGTDGIWLGGVEYGVCYPPP